MDGFSDIFRNKTILITGHTGFKGAWLAIWLKELGANVVGYALEPPTNPSIFELCGLREKIKSIHGDIKNFEDFCTVLEEHGPQIVFHLAAQPLVQISYSDPVETVSTNVLGTALVLEAIRKHGASVRVAQMITTDKCYENDETKRAYREEDALGGKDIYSASKAGAELVVTAYRNSFFPQNAISRHGVSLSSARAGNVIGGGDLRENRILPDCIRALSEKKPVILRHPNSTRPWQYVLDALSGYLRLAELQWSGSEIYASAWNFGPNESKSVSVSELTDQVIKEWGGGSWKPESSESPLLEADSLQLDSTKAKWHLQWQSVYTTNESIRRTVRWYQDVLIRKHKNPYDYSVGQIHEYMSTAKAHKHPWAIQEKALR